MLDNRLASHVFTWSRAPQRVSLAELGGRSSALLLRLATPWGVPAEAVITVRTASSDVLTQQVPLDPQGCASLDLTQILSAAHQHLSTKTEVWATIEAQNRSVRLHVLTLEREWQPNELRVLTLTGGFEITWHERFAVQGRGVRLIDLLRPWKPAATLAVPTSATGAFVAILDEVTMSPSLYRVELGLVDDWTSQFRPSASAELKVGNADDWRTDSLHSEPTGEGALYRLLVAHFDSSTGPGTVEEEDLIAGIDGLAEKVLRACVTVGFTKTNDALVQKLSRLLRKTPLEDVLSAVASNEAAMTAELVLKLGLLTRTTIMTGRGVPEAVLEALWRIWTPLGAWAELRCRRSCKTA